MTTARGSLRRSLFFVPGGEPRKLDKSRTLGADTLLLDLEDSVSVDEKSRARELVSGVLRSGDLGGAEAAVRVNPPGTPYFDEDLEAAVSAGAAAIMLPKAENPDRLGEVADRIQSLEAASGADTPVALLALVETARGAIRAHELPRASSRVEALCFGHADFSRDMGLVEADSSRGSVFHARCGLAIAARAAAVTPIDTVYLNVRDEEGFREDARLAASLGFDGKLCIHPSQVAIANEVYTPSAAEIDFATRVLEAGRRAREEGRGVFAVDGKMVDEPVLAAQRRVLDRARRSGIDVGVEEDG